MATRALPSDRLKTPICERLGIEYPVFQAGMGMVAHATLAAAVSEAGGLGVVGAGTDLTPEKLREPALSLTNGLIFFSLRSSHHGADSTNLL